VRSCSGCMAIELPATFSVSCCSLRMIPLALPLRSFRGFTAIARCFRAIAGTDKSCAAVVILQDKDVANLSPHRRGRH
jgi:hypothetical protein